MADEVSEERLRQIFEKRIVRFLGFANADPVHGRPPLVVLLGGQMAAGKSSSLARIIERHGGAIIRTTSAPSIRPMSTSWPSAPTTWWR